MTLVLAHRGSGPNGPEPENTVAAFLASRRFGADGVELDVRRTADGSLAVHHDAELADGRLICETRGPELPSSIPSLAEALAACSGLLVNVEIKNADRDPDFDPDQRVSRGTAELLARRNWTDGVVVSSFSRKALRAFSEVAPTVETAWLVGPERSAAASCVGAAEIGAAGIHPYETTVDESFVRTARAAGLAVRVWTVDDADRVAALARLGVEAVITNDVLAARSACEAARLA